MFFRPQQAASDKEQKEAHDQSSVVSKKGVRKMSQSVDPLCCNGCLWQHPMLYPRFISIHIGRSKKNSKKGIRVSSVEQIISWSLDQLPATSYQLRENYWKILSAGFSGPSRSTPWLKEGIGFYSQTLMIAVC